MKTRKQQAPAGKRAHEGPAARGPSRRRGAAAPKSRAAGQRPLALTAECTVAEADSLKAALARRLEDAGMVTLDARALLRIDTAALQLLLAFVRDRRSAGRPTEWRGHAPALDAAAAQLGLADLLGLPAAEAGR